jgi:hypothetical protein
MRRNCGKSPSERQKKLVFSPPACLNSWACLDIPLFSVGTFSGNSTLHGTIDVVAHHLIFLAAFFKRRDFP